MFVDLSNIKFIDFELPGFFNKGKMNISIANGFNLYGDKTHLLYINDDYKNPYFIATEVTRAMGYFDLNKPIRRLMKSAQNSHVYYYPTMDDKGFMHKIVRYIDKEALHLLALMVKDKSKSKDFLEELYECVYPSLDTIYSTYELYNLRR